MAKKRNREFPTRPTLIEATFNAMLACNGSATNDEIQDHVIRILELPDNVINIMHADNAQTKLKYELHWARTYLKNFGAIENSVRGVWAIVPGFETQRGVNGNEVCLAFRDKNGRKKSTPLTDLQAQSSANIAAKETPVEEDDEPWRAELSEILHEMDPFGFERLTMRLLRECGFSKVSVTKKTGDKGIDGYGKVSLNDIVTINVAFQCKRYKGLISSAQVRDFRGSLPSGIEKGILITTGAFTNDAVKEAMDSSKNITIDLIDGEELINLLLEHEIGVTKEIRTVYSVRKTFFDEI